MFIKQKKMKDLRVFLIFIFIGLLFVYVHGFWGQEDNTQSKTPTIYLDTPQWDQIPELKDWFRILFFWDLIFDRNVYQALSGFDLIKEHFSFRYKEQNIWDYNTSFYNIWKSADFVWFNLETPIWKSRTQNENWEYFLKNDCQKTDKSVAFCSHEMIVPVIKKLWFNTIALANNHSMDWWVAGHLSTIDTLENHNLNSFWFVKHWQYFDKNYVFTGSKNDFQYARHSFDNTIYWWLHNQEFCSILQQYSTTHTNFVVMHWGLEYKQTHSEWQQQVAEYLIDCWADVIIWSHPHVIQDIWWYNWKPIIYSLWNFLFDQYFSPETREWWYVLIDYWFDGEISLFTGSVNAYAWLRE